MDQKNEGAWGETPSIDISAFFFGINSANWFWDNKNGRITCVFSKHPLLETNNTIHLINDLRHFWLISFEDLDSENTFIDLAHGDRGVLHFGSLLKFFLFNFRCS